MKILPHTDPFLRTRAKPVEKITSEVLANIEAMLRLMRVENGVGLAAPQVGWDARVFVMNSHGGDPYMDMAWINPRLKLGAETAVSEEGCLSVRDEKGALVLGRVLRSRKVTVTGVCLARADRGSRAGLLCLLREEGEAEDPLLSSMHECSWEYTDEPRWPGDKNIDSFIAQHEAEHLNGVLFTDKLIR